MTPAERRKQREYRRRARRGVHMLRVPVDAVNFGRALVRRGKLSEENMLDKDAQARVLALLAIKIAREG